MGESNIKPATEADIYKMQSLWQSTPGLGVGPGDDEDSLKTFLKRNPTTCLVLMDDDQLIGTVLGGFDGRRGYIYHLAVHSDYQKKGYGKHLLNRALLELKALGAKKIHLFVLRDNENAINFYVYNNWKLRGDIQVLSWDDT
ncbi:MAG: GNAT family N-acetyltransferase [Syntrophomonadaceae bacterium]|nr:GNAT family N-acetyltransferase [Syntrophomonadaceae bacterium]